MDMDYADQDDYDFLDDEVPGYFYVEDGHEIADDLTERVVPDPTNYDSDASWDRYDYWEDIEYDTDGYGDDEQMIAGKKRTTKKPVETDKAKSGKLASRKRKHVTQSDTKSSKKRRTTGGNGIKIMPPVQLLAVKELRPEPRKEASIQDVSKLKSVAMPGWKDLLRGAGEKLMETVAQQSAADHIVSPSAEPGYTLELEEFEGEGEDEGEDMEEGPLDVEAIQLALRGNLQSLGLDLSAVDQGSLLALVQSMMAKDANADELLGNFIETLADDDENEGVEDENAPEEEIQTNGTKGGNVFGQAREYAKQKQPANEVESKALEPRSNVENEEPAPRRSKRKQEALLPSPPRRKRSRRDDGSVQA